jgi:hypothetical protein
MVIEGINDMDGIGCYELPFEQDMTPDFGRKRNFCTRNSELCVISTQVVNIGLIIDYHTYIIALNKNAARAAF